VVTATVDIVQLYSVVYGGFCGYNNSRYSAMVLGFCEDYCGYSNSRFSAMLLCFVCSLLLLQQQNV